MLRGPAATRATRSASSFPPNNAVHNITATRLLLHLRNDMSETEHTPPRRFVGKSALITGAARGIGAAVAHRLASEGCNVTCTDVNVEGIEATAAAARERGVDAIAVPCDVGDEASVKAAFSAHLEHFATLDVLVNMAGVLTATHSHEETLDNWERVLRINLTGMFLTCREALPHLLETKGNIVNAASTSSLSGHPWFAAYGASKGGVLMLSQSLAMEYAKRGVRVNCVAPGGINTDMVKVTMPDDVDFDILTRMMPLGPMGDASMVADTVAFLASDDARYVNGEYIRVDSCTLA